MLCVDLGESFLTHIYLQKLVSTQPRTSPLKILADTPSTAAPLRGRDAEVSLRRSTSQICKICSQNLVCCSSRANFAGLVLDCIEANVCKQLVYY